VFKQCQLEIYIGGGMFHVEPSVHTILTDFLGGVLTVLIFGLVVPTRFNQTAFPRFIIHRERSYWYMSVIVCVDHSVSTRRTHTRKQRGWGAVGSSMARLNKGTASSQFSISAYACSHSLAVTVMTPVHSSVHQRQ
jgi:hypothetical protein